MSILAEAIYASNHYSAACASVSSVSIILTAAIHSRTERAANEEADGEAGQEGCQGRQAREAPTPVDEEVVPKVKVPGKPAKTFAYTPKGKAAAKKAAKAPGAKITYSK